MSKAPQNLPSAGDRVRLRGRKSLGMLDYVNERLWANVKWDDPPTGDESRPLLCHLYELERVANSTSTNNSVG